MRTFLFIFVLLLAVTTIYGCTNKVKEAEEKARIEQERKQRIADDVVRGLFFIKDPMDNRCYAYYWGGMANGGPALMIVPCDSIPTDELYIGQR